MRRFTLGFGLFIASTSCLSQLNLIDVTIPLASGGATPTQTIGVNLASSQTLASPTIRNLGPDLIYGFDIAPTSVVGDLAWSFGWLVPYGYTFEIVADLTGTQQPHVKVLEIKDLTGIPFYNGAYVAFRSSADHSFAVSFSAQNLFEYNGLVAYTLYFRVYDSACSANNSGWVSFQHANCIALQIPIRKFNVAYYWYSNPQPPPSGVTPPPAPAVYKKIPNRPLNANPPQSYPVSTFLSCDAYARCQ